jgi:hypothetical protein
MMPREKWESDKLHRLRVRTPKYIPIVDDMAMLLSQTDKPKTTREVFDLWWDYDVQQRALKTENEGVGRRGKVPRNAPTRHELSGWLKRDARFHNINEAPRGSGRVAMWIYQEVV